MSRRMVETVDGWCAPSEGRDGFWPRDEADWRRLALRFAGEADALEGSAKGGVFTTHGQVTIEGKPFVRTEINDQPFGQLTPPEAYALGIRAISAAIEAERDAGMIRHLRSVGMPYEGISELLRGMREHRDQYDPPEGLGN